MTLAYVPAEDGVAALCCCTRLAKPLPRPGKGALTCGGAKETRTPNPLLANSALSNRGPLSELASRRRLRELQLARPWMEMLADGLRVVIDIEEWSNKSSGRGSITLGIDREDGEPPDPVVSWDVMLGLSDYSTVIPRMFAWATVGVHEETYDEADYALYEEECIRYDNEGDRLVSEAYSDWSKYRGVPALRPYANAMGEVDYWRLELFLNDLGKAFLLVDDFAREGIKQLTP